jgi:histidinol phosphatase-like enzyme
MIIYVDIDETICETPESRDYAKSVPITKNIKKINKLYDAGNTIIYWTARGSGTGLNWYDTTSKQLIDWGAKHHEVKVGKPTYDLFICDKAINSEKFFEEV